MGGKMNYGRVRIENLSMRHGSEWIPGGSLGSPPPPEAPAKHKSNTSRKPSPTSVPMSDCKCGKKTGSSEMHRKLCPLSKSKTSQAAEQLSKSPTRLASPPVSKNTARQVGLPKPEPIQTFFQFADNVWKVGELPALTRWLSELLTKIGTDATIDKVARYKLQKLAVELFRTKRLMQPPRTPSI